MRFLKNTILKQFMMKNIWSVITVMVLAALSALGRIGGVRYVETITDMIQAQFPNGMGHFIATVLLASGIMLEFYVSRVCAGIVATSIGEKLAVETRVRVVQHLAKIPFIRYEKYSTGELQSILRNDISIAVETIDTVFNSIFSSVILVILQACFMISLNMIAGIAVIVVGVGLSGMNHFVSKSYKKFQDTERKAISELTSVVESTSHGMDTVKMYKAKGYVMNFFLKSKQNYNKSTMNSAKIDTTSQGIYDFVSQGFFYIILIYLGFLGIDGSMSLGQILAFIAVYGDFITPMWALLFATRHYVAQCVAWQRVYDLLEVEEQEHADTGDDDGNIYTSIDKLEINNIGFSYDENTYILDDFSMTLTKGKSHVLIGGSGCGKTTFLKIMVGLYDTQKGDFFVDGHVAQRDRLFKSAVFVSSNNPLFTISIYDNITLGDRRITRHMCDDLARRLGIGGWIDSLPDGLDTIITEDSKNISGGQQQTINNMRALLSNSPIVIMDEPNSALDKDKELRLSKMIDAMKAEKIILITSHRADMINYCDSVFHF